MDNSIKTRIKNQIFKFEVQLKNSKVDDAEFTLDFERGRYRQKELVGIIRDVVPYFALTSDEISSIDKSLWNRQSFTRVSDANKNSKGDYGELLLYIILSIFYDVPKFVTKARLRSTTREQIKGFDCAHFSIENNDHVILWLGEAKFYKSFTSAIANAFKSVGEYFSDIDKVKSELRLLGGEIEINKEIEAEKYDLLKSYVDGGKSLDSVPINIPVLITYNSQTIKSFAGIATADISAQTFKDTLAKELDGKFKILYRKNWPSSINMKLVFILIPFESIEEIKSDIEIVERGMKF